MKNSPIHDINYKMLRPLIIFAIIATVYGAGEFSVIHHPGSLVFRGHDAIKESTLPEVFTAALGFSTEHFSHWQGFYISNPFNIPEAIVTIAVDGVQDIGSVKGHHFPLLTNEDESRVFKSLATRITERFPYEEPALVRIDLTNGLEDVQQYSILDGIKSENPKRVTHKHLKISVEEDRAFLKDIALLHEIANKIDEGVVKEDFVPDVYWFRISSLHALTDVHGVNSTEVKEANKLLQEAIARLTESFSKQYNNRVFVSIITNDSSHTRLKRAARADEVSDNDKSKYNLASKYTKEYPAIFNIILWFCVVMFFAIVAICHVTANMDPGRDSIIYRMTSTRMKKDN